MKIAHLALCAAALLSTTLPGAAKMASDRDRLRAQAEHACYVDANTLCPDAIPDEGKITACFREKRAQLSDTCGAAFDAGI